MRLIALFASALSLWLSRLTKLVLALAALVMVGSLLLGVFYRYVMQDAVSWSEEVALLGFTWTIFLAAALAVREDAHVRVSLIDSVLPGTGNWLLRQLIWVAIALTGAFMVWSGLEFIELTIRQVSAAMRYPLWFRNAAMPVAGALITVYALCNLERRKTFQERLA
ncbi:MAG: TRAP transporter small permease [Ectothiorhodospiraceae bacterium]|nr:TRAP transporter small permease [Ectothiorhodospiraceae bacterium]MCH8503167.1 TRAP transporter small permease [Ectothiorhodospiraceae bacterium]